MAAHLPLCPSSSFVFARLLRDPRVLTTTNIYIKFQHPFISHEISCAQASSTVPRIWHKCISFRPNFVPDACCISNCLHCATCVRMHGWRGYVLLGDVWTFSKGKCARGVNGMGRSEIEWRDADVDKMRHNVRGVEWGRLLAALRVAKDEWRWRMLYDSPTPLGRQTCSLPEHWPLLGP